MLLQTDTNRKQDWFYGTNSSLPKALDWVNWFKYWSSHIENMDRPIRFLVDATMRLQQSMVVVARRIRKNPGWERSFTMEEMRSIKDHAEEALAWYTRNRPREDAIHNFDPCLLILYKGLDGAFAILERLACELDQINRKGYLLINSADEVRAIGKDGGCD